MTAPVDFLEDKNNGSYSSVQELERVILTDPKLIPNGLNQVNHSVAETEDESNNEGETKENTENKKTQNNKEVNEILEEEEEKSINQSLEEKINHKLLEAVKNENKNNDIDTVIELSNMKQKSYASQLLADYTNSNKKSNNSRVELSNNRQHHKMKNVMSEIMRVFPLSIIILLLIFIILLIVCMNA